MKISNKFYKRSNFFIGFFPIIYGIITESFNVNKYAKFLMFLAIGLFAILLETNKYLDNKASTKKDFISLISWNLIIVILLISWLFKFVI